MRPLSNFQDTHNGRIQQMSACKGSDLKSNSCEKNVKGLACPILHELLALFTNVGRKGLVPV